MIIETAHIIIDPARAEDFEAAVKQAVPHFKTSEGCLGMALERVIETPGRYTLRIQWVTVEHHTIGFRQSENFVAWRALAGPFFEAPPKVEHVEIVSTYF